MNIVIHFSDLKVSWSGETRVSSNSLTIPYIYIKARDYRTHEFFHIHRTGSGRMYNDLFPTSGCQSDKNQRYEESLVTDVYHIHDRRDVVVDLRLAC